MIGVDKTFLFYPRGCTKIGALPPQVVKPSDQLAPEQQKNHNRRGQNLPVLSTRMRQHRCTTPASGDSAEGLPPNHHKKISSIWKGSSHQTI
ncbi:MAG: hypothetical protein NTW32_19245, partial [Chloroflexi bacterium]|nr:hypothetical protein [Chloroflexota bacterium]